MLENVLLKIGTTTDPFDFLGGKDVISHDTKSYNLLSKFTADWISLVLIGSVIAALVTVVYLLVKYMVMKKADSRAEIKTVISWKLIVLFSVEAIGLIISVVTSAVRAFV